MIKSPAFAGKRYAVLGLARSGTAVVETLLASGAQVTAWDSREEPRGALAARHGTDLNFEDPTTIDLAGFAAVVVSPGVPLNRHPIAEAAAAAEVPVWSLVQPWCRSTVVIAGCPYPPLLYVTFLMSFFADEQLDLDLMYYSEMHDAGCFDEDGLSGGY